MTAKSGESGNRRERRRDRKSRRLASTTPAWIAGADDGDMPSPAADDANEVPPPPGSGRAGTAGATSAPSSPDAPVGAPDASGGAAEATDDAPKKRRGMVGGRNLPLAIAVGVALIGVVGGALWWHPWAFAGVIALLTMAAYYEIKRVLLAVELRIDVPVATVATIVMIAGAFQARQAGQLAGVLVLIAGAFLWHLADPVRVDVVRSASLTVMFGMWIGFLASHAVLLVNRPFGGIELVIAVVGAAALMDTGGYIIGVALGRHPVAPSVSPNKTWEGLLGGFVFVAVGGAVGLPLLNGPFDALSGAVVALACGLAAFVGDLIESMVKRDLGVKDMGHLLPGHGGVLDRVDGILWALPVGYYVAEVLGV
ncbi:MAG: phosphatidate cytidylyltransferase [Nitriliruptoraceae bacterium]